MDQGLSVFSKIKILAYTLSLGSIYIYRHTHTHTHTHGAFIYLYSYRHFGLDPYHSFIYIALEYKYKALGAHAGIPSSDPQSQATHAHPSWA
jgi:hypothetical protein